MCDKYIYLSDISLWGKEYVPLKKNVCMNTIENPWSLLPYFTSIPAPFFFFLTEVQNSFLVTNI